jgi:hypothetical protein
VNEFVAGLLGVKQTSTTDKGYVPTSFPYQKKKQLRLMVSHPSQIELIP